MKRTRPKESGIYRVIAIATIRLARHEDFWRSRRALQRLLESEFGQLLLHVCGFAVTIEHVVVEPVSVNPDDS